MSSTLKKQLQSRSPVFGTWSMLGSPAVGEVLAGSGLDFVIIDIEHGAIDFSQCLEIVRSVQAGGSKAIIRVSENREPHILRFLEMRPDGILVPHIRTKEEAKRVIQSCYYPPHGDRGLSPYTRVHSYTHQGLQESMHQANEQLMVGILVEGREGIDSVPQITELQGVDLIYFGIYDFTKSIGFGDRIDHPEVIGALEKLVKTCEAAGVSCGTFVRTLEDTRKFRDLGLRFLAFGADSWVLKDAYTQLTHRWRTEYSL